MRKTTGEESTSPLSELDARSQEIFRQVVESYLEGGAPVGSQTVAKELNGALSPASVRAVMAELEGLGFLYAPHVSAGRLPTERGLRLFIDGLLKLGDLPQSDCSRIEALCAGAGRNLREVLREVGEGLSGLAQCASLVITPKEEQRAIRHIEFVRLDPGRALVVIVDTHDLVENRLIDLPPGLPAHALIEASNYLNDRFAGRSLEEAGRAIEADMAADQAELDAATQKVIEAGLAVRTAADGDPSLILTGRARTLEGVQERANMERVQLLFEALERGRTLRRLLDSTLQGSGVHVFIGAETELFALSGCSMIVAPLVQNESGAGPPGRHRRDRAHAAQLRPHHPDGGLHGARRGPPARLSMVGRRAAAGAPPGRAGTRRSGGKP